MVAILSVSILVIALFIEHYLFSAIASDAHYQDQKKITEDCTESLLPIKSDGSIDYDTWTEDVFHEYRLNNRQYSELGEESMELIDELMISLGEPELNETVVSVSEPLENRVEVQQSLFDESEMQSITKKVKKEKAKDSTKRKTKKLSKQELEMQESYKEFLKNKVLARENSYDEDYYFSKYELLGMEGRFEEQMQLAEEYFQVYGEHLAG